MSRPLATNPLRNKPVAVIGASTGVFGAVWSQAELRKVLAAIGARVVEDGVALTAPEPLRRGNGRLVDEQLCAELEAVWASSSTRRTPARRSQPAPSERPSRIPDPAKFVALAKVGSVPVRKALVISALAVAVLAGSAAAALQRFDSSRSDEIAEGISVAGVDVGGMTVAEAKVAVRKEVAHRLDQPLRITHLKRTFTVDPALVDVQTNVDELFQSAMAKSREGNFLTRSLRDLTGRTEETDLELKVEYSQEAVGRDRRHSPRGAAAGPRRHEPASFAGVQITPSQLGVALRPRLLRNEIVDHLVSPDSSRTFAVPVRIVRPKVTTKKLKARYDHFIAISRSRRELRHFVNRRLVKTYRVGIGAAGFDTPAGEYEIESMAANPAWYVPNSEWAGDLAGKVISGDDPSNPIKARWMGFYDGAGIHGTADEASMAPRRRTAASA